ncbi:hypothetical protein V6N13_135259 [Hibiscus sabdariffa]
MMENPNSEFNTNITPTDGVRSSMAFGGLILGNMGGRPPDNVVSMEECSVRERPVSSDAVDLQPASKKGRNFEDPKEVLEQPEMVTAEGRNQGLEANAFSGSQERVASFKETLLGGIDRNHEELLVEELDVEVRDEDVLIRGDGVLLEIRFSDREVCGLQANQVAEGEVTSIRRDPHELYGPSMQVVNKRRKNMTKTSALGGSNGASNGGIPRGSRFVVLTDEEEVVTVGDGGELREAQVQVDHNLGTSNMRPRREGGSLALAREGTVATEHRINLSTGVHDSIGTGIRIGKELRNK